jgi:3-oxoacyl-[acyl-carrier protein] reductase
VTGDLLLHPPGSEPPLAVVTGAANPRGIGAAIARRLVAGGVAVFLIDRPGAPELAAVAADVGADGGEVAHGEIDLADAAGLPGLLDAAEAAFGRPATVLVNNAAHSVTQPWEELDAAGLDAHYAVNVRAPVLLGLELVRRLPAGRAGRIVNLVSGQWVGPMPDELAYTTTKGALATFTQQFAAEVAGLGVTVNAVNPGPVETGWMGPELAAALGARFPGGRAGEPDDAARLVAFLVSDEARWITGQVITSEGGFRH